MGTQGVPIDIPKSSIIATLKKNRGRINASCKDLDCSHSTLEKLIKKDPELVEILAGCRRGVADEFVDQAEDFLFAIANDCKDPKIQLNATFFILNTNDLAKERFWGNVAQVDIETKQQVAQLKVDLAERLELIELRAAQRAGRSDSQAQPMQPAADPDKSQSGV